MRLRARIVLFLTIATLVPVGVLGAAAVRIATRRLDARVAALQGRTAEGLAVYVDTWLEAREGQLAQQAVSLPVAQLGPEERVGLQRLIYRQQTDLAVVALLDGAGQPVVPPVSLPNPAGSGDPALVSRLAVDEVHLKTFLDAARGATGSRSRPWQTSAAPVVALLAPTAAPDVQVAAELSLQAVAERFGALQADAVDVALLDQSGAVILGGQQGLVVPGYFRAFLGTAGADGIRYALDDGTEVLAATAPVGPVGWTVVVAEPEQVTSAAVDDIRDRTAFVGLTAVAVSLVLGALFSRQLSRPVVAVKDAALAVAGGARVRPLPERGNDEITELARAFNFMSRQLEASAREIEAQQAEITAFNEELQERVAERTAQLRETQAQLIHSARLAATGELGASLAHELNNPIAGILGLVQVLRRRADGPLLASVEEQAQRCREIVSRITRLATQPPPARAETQPLEESLDRVERLVSPLLRQRQLTLRVAPTGELRLTTDPAVEQALTQLVLSVRAAAASPGVVTVEAQGSEQTTRSLSVHLDAARICIGGDDWRAAAMGVWAARQVLDARGGRLDEPEPPPESGRATWVLHLRG